MGENSLILRLSFIVFLLTTINLFAVNVIVSSKTIAFEEKVDSSKIRSEEVSEINKFCIPLKLSDIEENNYIATHHINRNTVICMKDVRKSDNQSIIFNFGGVKIEKKGKIIYENKDFIRIKNVDGTIEQIYKDGRIK
jgi:hypothetical protein